MVRKMVLHDRNPAVAAFPDDPEPPDPDGFFGKTGLRIFPMKIPRRVYLSECPACMSYWVKSHPQPDHCTTLGALPPS